MKKFLVVLVAVLMTVTLAAKPKGEGVILEDGGPFEVVTFGTFSLILGKPFKATVRASGGVDPQSCEPSVENVTQAWCTKMCQVSCMTGRYSVPCLQAGIPSGNCCTTYYCGWEPPQT